MAKQSDLSDFEVQGVVNAAGTMTSLGANRVCPEALAAMTAISQSFISIDRLQAHASGSIAAATKAEAGFVTSCTAAGVSLAVAACITGDDLDRIERLPAAGGAAKVLIQRGHMINYGAPIDQSIRLAGAQVVEIGAATEAFDYQLDSRLRDDSGIVAALYVVSHHTALEGMLPMAEFTAICHRHGVPVIADMASEQDLQVACDPGVDIAIYSGHKFLGGPTSGIVAGREKLVRAAYLQNRGIGRAMKVGKEGICGALAALEAWLARDRQAERDAQAAVLAHWSESFNQVAGLSAAELPDWTGNPLARMKLTVDPELAGLYAWELADRLRAQKPAIHVREQFAEHQILVLDPCYLADGEQEIVAARIKSVCEQALASKDGKKLSWTQYKQDGAAAALRWPHG